MKVAYFRGQVTNAFKSKYPKLRGAMLAVGCTESELKPHLDSVETCTVVIAAINSPASLTVSGDEEAILELQLRLEAERIFNRKLRVDMAYHSHHMELIAQEYLDLLEGITPTETTEVQFYSTVTGTLLDSQALQPSYWVANLTSTVRFSEALARLCGKAVEDAKAMPASPINMVIEVGPHSALEGPVRQTIKGQLGNRSSIDYASCLVRKKNAVETSLQVAAKLCQKGYHLDYKAVNFPFGNATMKILTDMDPYPWQHGTKYWHESRITQTNRLHITPRHDLLGTIVDDCADMESEWRNILRLSELPWLEHHMVHSNCVFPLAGYVVLGLEAMSQRAMLRKLTYDSFVLRDVSFSNPLVIYEATEVEIKTTVKPHKEGRNNCSPSWEEFRISSWTSRTGWLEHCRGLIAIRCSMNDNPIDGNVATQNEKAFMETIKKAYSEGCSTYIDIPDIYRTLAAVGLALGDTFQAMKSCQASSKRALAEVGVVETASIMPERHESKYVIHPSTLDAITQAAWPILSASQAGLHSLYRASSIKDMAVSRNIECTAGAMFRVYCSGSEVKPTGDSLGFNFFVTQSQDAVRPMIRIDGYVKAPVRDTPMSKSGISDIDVCYKLNWEPVCPATAKHQVNGAASRPSSLPADHQANEIASAQSLELANRHVNEIASSTSWPTADHQSNGIASPSSLKASDHPVNGVASSPSPQSTSHQLTGSVTEPSAPPADHQVNGLQSPPPSPRCLVPDISVVTLDRRDTLQDIHLMTLINTVGLYVAKRPTLDSIRDIDPEGKILIVLIELERPCLAAMTSSMFELMQRLITKASGILWPTRGGYLDSTSPDLNMVSGFARSVRSESALKFVTVDVDSSPSDPTDTARIVAEVFRRSFFDQSCKMEYEYMERKGSLFIPRIQPDLPLSDFIRRNTGKSPVQLHSQRFSEAGRNLRLSIAQNGSLETLQFIENESLGNFLGVDDIEIEVKAISLNFKDVVIAMGQLPGDLLGQECSGIVAAVGCHTTGFNVGDRVCAISPGCLANKIRCRATNAVCIPDAMSLEVAATLPIAYCTAYYSLLDIGRLTKNEKVLIHAGAGGVGQAAVGLAQSIGADVFATVGSASKKTFLMERYGLREDHIFYSRDTSFKAGVMRMTNNKGVDVVLNSLAGDALHATLECLNTFGRFIEIGTRDIVENSELMMAPFSRNIMFASVDLGVVAAERPQLMQALLNKVLDHYRDGRLQLISPLSTFPILEVESALRTLQGGKSMGKIVVVPGTDDRVKVS